MGHDQINPALWLSIYEGSLWSRIKAIMGHPVEAVKKINGVAITAVKSWLGVSID